MANGFRVVRAWIVDRQGLGMRSDENNPNLVGMGLGPD
jgi:hypothetical protein